MKITKKLPLKNVINFHEEIKDRTEEVLERKSLVSTFTPLEEGEAMGIISAPSVDNDGDIIDPMGVDASIYTGTVQWNHDLSTLPLGTVSEFSITPEGVKGKFRFSKTYDFAQDVYNLVKENILKGISIGYIPLKTLKRGTTAFNDYAKAKGWDIEGCERIITNCLWIESSLCPVGCNNDALIFASKSFKSELAFKNFKIETKGCKEEEVKEVDENEVVVEDNVENVSKETEVIPEEIKAEVTEAVVETPDILIVEEIPLILDIAKELSVDAQPEEVVGPILPIKDEVEVIQAASIEVPEEQEVIQPKKLVLKVLRVGKLQSSEEIKRKALLFLQGKSF